MLAFVTSLRHPRNAIDYDEVEELLRQTLASVTQQTSEDFVVIVVGNRKPAFPLPDKVHFVEVGFRAPAPKDSRARRHAFIRDKGTKIGIGLIAARQFDPDYVMIFDADDFVHRDLAKFVGERPGHPGWIIRDGWMYSRRRSAYREQPEFNTICGTCFVIPFAAYGVPEDLDVTATRGLVKTAYGDRLSKIIGAHKFAEEWYAEHGRQLETLPFPGAVYHVDTGENHSRKEKLLAGRAKPLDAMMRAEFGISTRRTRLGVLFACYCSETTDRLVAPFVPAYRFGLRALRAVYRRSRRLAGKVKRRVLR